MKVEKNLKGLRFYSVNTNQHATVSLAEGLRCLGQACLHFITEDTAGCVSSMFSLSPLVHPKPQNSTCPPNPLNAMWSNPGAWGTQPMSQLQNPNLKKSQSFKCGTHKCPNIVLGDIIFTSQVKMNLSSALEGDIIFIFQVQSTWVCH